jgi:hypothetical protein
MSSQPVTGITTFGRVSGAQAPAGLVAAADPAQGGP